MTLTSQLGIFLLLVFLTALARSRLVYELAAGSMVLFRTPHPGRVFYALLTFPGTVLHELSHWLVAEILGVRTGQIRLLPDWSGDRDESILGSVMTARPDPFRGFLIGLAPFLSGTGVLLILGYLLSIWWGTAPLWQLLLIFYGLVVVGNGMLISRADRQFFPLIAILTATVAIALYLGGVRLEPSFIQTSYTVLTRVNQALGLTIALNLAIIGTMRGARYILERYFL